MVCESETWKIRGRYQPKSLDTFILFVHRPDQIGFSEHQTFNHHKTQHLVRKTPLVSLRSFHLPPYPSHLTLPYLTVSFLPPPLAPQFHLKFPHTGYGFLELLPPPRRRHLRRDPPLPLHSHDPLHLRPPGQVLPRDPSGLLGALDESARTKGLQGRGDRRGEGEGGEAEDGGQTCKRPNGTNQTATDPTAQETPQRGLFIEFEFECKRECCKCECECECECKRFLFKVQQSPPPPTFPPWLPPLARPPSRPVQPFLLLPLPSLRRRELHGRLDPVRLQLPPTFPPPQTVRRELRNLGGRGQIQQREVPPVQEAQGRVDEHARARRAAEGTRQQPQQQYGLLELERERGR